MPVPLSNDDTRRWPPGKGLEFEKFVVFSAWLLLASYDEDDDTLEDAASTAIKDDDDTVEDLLGELEEDDGYENIWNATLERVKLSTWRRWRHLDHLDDAQFQEALAGEIMPALERDFPARSHPLTLVRLALDDKPIGVVRGEWQRAIEFWGTGGEFNRDDARAEWEVQSVECSISQHGGRGSSPSDPRPEAAHRETGVFSLPYQLQDFLAGALVPQWGDHFLDLSARDGGVANRAAELGARRFTLYERDPDLALLAATRIRLHRACEVSVFLDDPLAGYEPEPVHDCVVATPPFGLKVEMPAGSSAPVPTQRAELIQLQRAVAALKPGGRAAVLMPNRFLFADGDDRRVREWLLREHCVEVVVELPGRTFSLVSEVKTTVILIRRQAPREDVWFIRADQFLNASERPIGSEPGGVDYEILHTAIAARWNLGKPEELRAEIAKLETAAANEKYELVEPDGVAWLTENNRQLLALARHFLGDESPETQFPELVSVEEILRRKAELLWKENRGESLDALLSELAATREGVRLARLEEVTEVLGGATYTAREFLEPVAVRRRARGDAIGLVRVSDFPRFAPGESAVRTLRDVKRHIEKLPPKNENRVLRPDDMLVSIGGTIGRVCLFEVELGHPSLAGNGLAIIRTKDRLTSAFLAKLFTSEPYQQWFAGESTGSTIRHLTLTRLRELPVPVLSRADMLSIADELEIGASEARVRAVFTGKRDFSELASRLLESRSISAFAELSPDKLELGTGTELLKIAYDEIASWGSVDIHEDDTLRKGLNVLQRLAKNLLDALALPETGDRFSVLQEWRSSAGRRQREIGHYLNELVHAAGGDDARRRVEAILPSRTEGFISNLLRIAQTAIQRQLSDVRLTATIAPAGVTVGEQTEVTITVRNEGTIAVKSVTLTFPDEAFRASDPWPLLAGLATNQWPFPWLPKQTGKKLFRIEWHALRLDEEKVSGVFELAVEVQPRGAGVTQRRFDETPYIAGPPLSAKYREKFFGRQDIISEIQRSLRLHGPGTVLILEGVRRVGKSSLLEQLLAPDVLPGWLPVYYCFQGAGGDEEAHGVPTREMFYEIAKELILAAHGAGCTVDVPDFRSVLPTDTTKQLRLEMRTVLRGKFAADSAPFELFELIVTSVLDAIGDRRLLLMLDEFDKVQVGIETGVTNPNVPENFRELIHRHEKLSAILTGSQLMKTLRREYFHPLFGIGKAIPIGALDRASAQLLVTRPAEGTLIFSDTARDTIVDLCACQPYLIQYVCDAVFEIAASTGQESITTEHVEKAAALALNRDQHFTTVLRKDVQDPRRQFVLFVVAELERGGVQVTFEALRDTLEERGLAGDDALTKHLQYLKDVTVVNCEGGDERKLYRIATPLLARWLARQDSALYLARAQRFDEGRL